MTRLLCLAAVSLLALGTGAVAADDGQEGSSRETASERSERVEDRLRPIVRHPRESQGEDDARRERKRARDEVDDLPAEQADRDRFAEITRSPQGRTMAGGFAPAETDAELLDRLPGLDSPRIASLRRRVRAKLADPGAWIELGNGYAKANREQAALDCYREATRLAPDRSAAWNNMGGIHLRLYENEQALEAFQRALSADAFNALAHYNAGVANDRLGHYDQAIEHYQRALTLDPSLKIPSYNPNIVNNEHMQILNLRLYRDQGGALVLPLQGGEE